MEKSSCPEGNFVDNKCPGGENNKCCLSAPYQEDKCQSEGGTCLDECGCKGDVLTGFCPTQPASIKCCVEEEVVENCNEEVTTTTTVPAACVNKRRKREAGCSSEPSEACAGEGGHCGNPNSCPDNNVVHNKCPGGQDNKCCLSMPYQEPECEAEGGTCVDKCECEGEILHGFCPNQPNSIKCCKSEITTTEVGVAEATEECETEATTAAATTPLHCPGGYNTNCNNGECVVTCSGGGNNNNNGGGGNNNNNGGGGNNNNNGGGGNNNNNGGGGNTNTGGGSSGGGNSPSECSSGYNTNCNNGVCTVTCSGGSNNNNNNNGRKRRRRKRSTGEICNEEGSSMETGNQTSCNRQQGECSSENPDYIKLQFSCFIPKSKGKPWSDLGFGNEPPQMVGRGDNWFEGPPDWTTGDMYTTTNDREKANVDGGYKMKTLLYIKTSDIGNLEKSNLNESTTVGASQKVHIKNKNIIKDSFKEDTAPLGDHEITLYNFKHTPCKSIVCIKAAAAFPFHSFAPDIDYKVCFEITHYQQGYTVTLHGWRNDFPAYEAFVNDELEYTFYPTSSGPGIWNLGILESNIKHKTTTLLGESGAQRPECGTWN